jgi:hypothetical protein
MLASFCFLLAGIFSAAVLADADTKYRRVVNGYNDKSYIMNLTPGSLESGDEFGIKVDVW